MKFTEKSQKQKKDRMKAEMVHLEELRDRVHRERIRLDEEKLRIKKEKLGIEKEKLHIQKNVWGGENHVGGYRFFGRSTKTFL